VNGVATFSNLSINKAGTGYTLSATSSGLTGATSNAFNITGGRNGQVVIGWNKTEPRAPPWLDCAFRPSSVTLIDVMGGITGLGIHFAAKWKEF